MRKSNCLAMSVIAEITNFENIITVIFKEISGVILKLHYFRFNFWNIYSNNVIVIMLFNSSAFFYYSHKITASQLINPHN